MLEINLSQFKKKETPQNHQSGDNKLLDATLSWINEESIEHATNEASSEDSMTGEICSEAKNIDLAQLHAKQTGVVLKPMSLK